MRKQNQENTSYRVAKNSLYLIGGQIACKIFTLLFYIIMARYLGEMGIGKYVFIINLIGMFIIFTNFGFDNLLVRDLSVNKEKTIQYLSNIISIKIIFSILSLAMLTFFILKSNKSSDVIWGVILVSLIIFPESIANTLESIFNAFEELKYVAYIQIIISVLKILVAIMIKWTNQNLTALLIAIVLISFIRVSVGFCILTKRFLKPRIQIQKSVIIDLLKNAYPFALMGIMSVIYFRIDTIMLSFMVNDSAVGWYAVSFNFISILMFISYGFSRAIFPTLSRYFHISVTQLLTAGEKAFNYLLIIGLPIAAGTSIIAHQIILLLYGEQFINSVLALRILIWTIPFIYMNTPLLKILYSAYQQKIAIMVMLAGTLLNIVLNLILIPKLSFIGSSISTLASEILTFLLYYGIIMFRFHYKIKFNSAVYKCFGVVSLMSIITFLLRNLHPFISISIAILFYGTSLFIFKILSTKDIALIRSLIFKNETNTKIV